jgi:hypothetical protein
MRRKNTKKKTKGKLVASDSLSRNRSSFKTEWFGAIFPLVLGLGVQYVIPIESAFGAYFGWFCYAVALGLLLRLLWKQIAWLRFAKGLLVCVIAGVFLWVAQRNIVERLRPSFVFAAPGVWLNEDTWAFLMNHRGPKTSYNTQILFVDQDRKDALTHMQTSLSPADINIFQGLLSFSEVNPMGRGSIFAQQFLWKPFSPTHSHFNAEITWRDGAVHQELEIAKRQEKWTYRMKVIDRDSGKILLWCHDKDFPSNEPTPPCFPAAVQPSN